MSKERIVELSSTKKVKVCNLRLFKSPNKKVREIKAMSLILLLTNIHQNRLIMIIGNTLPLNKITHQNMAMNLLHMYILKRVQISLLR